MKRQFDEVNYELGDMRIPTRCAYLSPSGAIPSRQGCEPLMTNGVLDV